MGLNLETVGGSTNIKLLWKHPSSGAGFNAQKVSVDLLGYDAVLVTFRNVSGVDVIAPAVIAPLKQTAALNGYYNDYGISAACLTTRSFTADTTGVQFTGGTIFISTQGAPHADDNVSIPAEIYGVQF